MRKVVEFGQNKIMKKHLIFILSVCKRLIEKISNYYWDKYWTLYCATKKEVDISDSRSLRIIGKCSLNFSQGSIVKIGNNVTIASFEYSIVPIMSRIWVYGGGEFLCWKTYRYEWSEYNVS